MQFLLTTINNNARVTSPTRHLASRLARCHQPGTVAGESAKKMAIFHSYVKLLMLSTVTNSDILAIVDFFPNSSFISNTKSQLAQFNFNITKKLMF
jgi:hypothetical protein